MIENTPLLIGNGRLARHLEHYFSLLEKPLHKWTRSDSIEDLEKLLVGTQRVFLAIPDQAIEAFVEKHKKILKNKTLVHFSGCMNIDSVISAHPLMTFTNDLYDLETYRSIAFIISKPHKIKSILPELNNPSYSISEDDKALYHALCVMSGNFSVLLWQKLFSELESSFNIPKEAALPYMKQVFKNLLESPDSALTGPLTRGDNDTLKSHHNSLLTDPYLPVFEGFLKAHSQSDGKVLQ